MKRATSVDILGTKISILDYRTALSVIEDKIKAKSNFVCVSAVHLLMESYNDKHLQKFINKSLITTPDGMPIVWIAKSILKRRVQRIYGPDLMLKVCKLAQKKGYKIFLLGGAEFQGDSLRKNLIKEFPKLKIVGIEETPTRPIPEEQNRLIIKKIRKVRPDIVFVGLGCPLQEKWMMQNYKKFNSGIFIGVGAAFDFIAKRVKQAPEWIRNIGFEWLFRLFQDPKRLWKRYLFTNIQFLFEVIKNYKTFYERKTAL
jgi:N-acetylglucosaminyldiphosphoundecaprenol N-acetyl-beta-D-mannosaminyltransferase